MCENGTGQSELIHCECGASYHIEEAVEIWDERNDEIYYVCPVCRQ